MEMIKARRRKLTAARNKKEYQPITEEAEITVRRATTRRGKKKLEAAMVDNKLVQDKSKNMGVVGADVEALYPSLDAIQVADIVFKAVMETEVGFDELPGGGTIYCHEQYCSGMQDRSS